MKKLIKNDRYAWIFAAISVIVIFLTHHYVPFMMDDFWYSTVLSSEEPIRNFSDIINAQIWHYNNWGGRSMTHTLLQCILLGGETFADVLNTLVTFLLAALILIAGDSFIGTNDKESSKQTAGKIVLKLTVVTGMLIGLNANWRMSMFWESVAVNYLYISCFIVVFIHAYLRELDDCKSLPGCIIWIIPLGIISGWSNENMGPVAFLISIAVMIILKKKKKSVKAWMIAGSISSLLGSVACIIAPGNSVTNAQGTENGNGK